MVRIAVLVSGGGTNLQALIDGAARGEIPHGELALVLSSSREACALRRGEAAGIETTVLSARDYAGPDAWDAALTRELQDRGIGLVVLAGYLSILGPRVLEAFRGRMVNVHPSLLPSFGGRGFYGLRVHQAALEYGVKVTGATVHLVSQEVDGGEILLQKAVPVEEGDTPQTLQRRVMEQAEWELLPKAVAMLCRRIEEERGF